MNELVVFKNEELRAEVRTIEIENEPWFVAKDVCDALGIGNVSMALSKLDNDEKGISKIDTLGGNQSLSIINESGLYSLILRSNKPEAKKFKKWVTSEVLPSIRKTGAYISTMPDFNNPAEAARAWADEYEKRKALEPKAEAYNVISNSNRLSTVTEIAGLFNMGRNTMYKWLRKNGYVMKHINKPYQKFIDAELFDWKVDRVNGMLHYVVLVTGKGILEIERKLQEEKEELLINNK
jgi:prophage antirepressor-like protein